MYYEQQILPIDDDGNFLLAVHFRRHKIGGECIRESSHAYFACGHVKTLDNLTDVTHLFCIERPPNKEASIELTETAKVQKEVVGQPETAWQYSYQARKALEKSAQVPRLVLASRSGLVHVGMDADLDDLDAGTCEFVHRVVDLQAGKITVEKKITEPVDANPIIFPKAISDDARRVVSVHHQSYNKIYSAEFSYPEFKLRKQYKSLFPVADFVHLDDHWIAINDNEIYKFPIGSNKHTAKFKSPKNGWGWTATGSRQGKHIAISGDKGAVFTVNTDDGTIKTYFPHVGAKRDDFALSKLSDDGRWMASKLAQKSDVVLTDLTCGESWVVAQIEDQTIVEHQEGPYKSESTIPACFNFIANRLLVSDTSLREITISRPSDPNSIFISEQGRSGARKPLRLKASDPMDIQLDKAGLTKYAESVKKFHSPGCLLKTAKPRTSGWSMPDKRGAPALGVSRLGGWPDLPGNTEWPTWNERPMAFLGQINLAEVTKVQPEIRLPKAGVLLFFVGCNADTFQRDPFDQDMYMLELMPGEEKNTKDAVKVVYAEENATLARTIYEGDVLPELFQPCNLNLKGGALSLPHECTSAYHCLPLSGTEVTSYNELLDILTTDESENQFLGYPTVLQSTPLEWGPENIANGRDFFSVPESEAETAKFSVDASQWGLLLQLTSDGNPDFIWGDAGNLYIYGKTTAMEKGNSLNAT